MADRRTFLRGLATLPLVGAAAFAATAASPAADARLVELVDAYAALDRTVNATHSEAPGYDDLVSQYPAMEAEMAETPSVSMVGVLAKARACQLSCLRDCADMSVMLSVADDLVRLHAA